MLFFLPNSKILQNLKIDSVLLGRHFQQPLLSVKSISINDFQTKISKVKLSVGKLNRFFSEIIDDKTIS